MKGAKLTHSGDLSYTARRAAGDGFKGAVVIYWPTTHKEERKRIMEELGISGMSVNGETIYRGNVSNLEPFIKEGLIVVRKK